MLIMIMMIKCPHEEQQHQPQNEEKMEINKKQEKKNSLA